MKYDINSAVKLINEKLEGNNFLTYNDIAIITGYHPKYILKLKRDILNKQLRTIHGNKNKKPHNALSVEEEQKIINLYRRTNVSIEKFTKFYGSRSYSCIYNVLKRNGLLKTK